MDTYYQWIVAALSLSAAYLIISRVYFLLRYLLFKINVLEEAVARMYPDEPSREKIRLSVKTVLDNDYEHKVTVSAIKFAKKFHFVTVDNPSADFDPSHTIEEIEKSHKAALKREV